MRPVLILGGYGNFGKRIAAALARAGVPVVVAGRSREKAETLASHLPGGMATATAFDVRNGLDDALQTMNPAVVVNTCGPFQTSDYSIARAAIRHGVHYVDLADGRTFVTGIGVLNAEAKARGVTVVSGASTVPGLSSAVLDHYRPEFRKIERLRYGISPGQSAERGLATTRGILTYVGRPLKPYAGHRPHTHGWQDIHRQAYPGLGKRWFANCDIPDLDLLPARYGIPSIQFSAGLELGVLHLGLWGLSWLVRIGLPLSLPRLAPLLLGTADWFNRFGSADGGMHIILDGEGTEGGPRHREWYIIARSGDGPHIPTIPTILLAQRLAGGQWMARGAYPCLGLVTLEDYLAALQPFDIKTYEFP